MPLRLALLAAFAAALLLPLPTSAQECTRLTWGETRTRAFIFSYQEANPLGAEIAAEYGEALDAEFNRFANLFNVSLPVPILVRIYPTERDYYCFNALAPQIPLGQTHSRIGGREIALIAQNIQDDPAAWARTGFEDLRFELAVLFTNHLSAGSAPPGLQIGAGNYLRDPFLTFESTLQATRPPTAAPGASWRTLWENPNLTAQPENTLQAASITAFLVDVYGWDRFLDFLQLLRTAESWRLALEEAYPASAGALEKQWSSEYYPLYFDGRWRDNAVHSLSLTPYEQLIAAGAYQAAAEGLEAIIELLVDLEDFDQLSRAQELNAQAQSGLAADAGARAARQAYLEGDFESAQELAFLAEERYAALGDSRNMGSLAVIRTQAGEVLALRTELAVFAERSEGLGGSLLGPRLAEIAARLQELGDEVGADEAAGALQRLNARKQAQSLWIAAGGAAAAAAMVVHLLRSLGRVPPPEAQLPS